MQDTVVPTMGANDGCVLGFEIVGTRKLRQSKPWSGGTLRHTGPEDTHGCHEDWWHNVFGGFRLRLCRRPSVGHFVNSISSM